MTESVTIIGNTNLDVMVGDTRDLPAPGTERVVGSISIRVGGSAGNLAVRCAGLGFATTLVSRVGDDLSTPIMEAGLQLPGLRARLLRSAGEPSGITVAVEASGRDRAFLSSLGAMALLAPSDIDEALLAGKFLAVAGYFLLPGMRGPGLTGLFERARVAGAQTVLDIGWPTEGWSPSVREEVLAILESVDIFLPNDDEVHGLTGDPDTERAARHLAVSTNTLVVVKMGEDGAGLAAPDGRWLEQKAPRVDVVDSTGAGDGFNAAFLVGIARGDDLTGALAAAVGYATELVATEPDQRSGVTLALPGATAREKDTGCLV